jgi:hypothetical protein
MDDEDGSFGLAALRRDHVGRGRSSTLPKAAPHAASGCATRALHKVVGSLLRATTRVRSCWPGAAGEPRTMSAPRTSPRRPEPRWSAR